MSIMEDYFTVAQAAKELDVTRQTIFRWIKDGKLPAEKTGREHLIAKTAATGLKQSKFEGWIYEMFGYVVTRDNFSQLREALGYTEKDKIEQIGYIGNLEYLVKKRNGEKEKLTISKFGVELDRKTYHLVGTLRVDDIIREPYIGEKAKTKTQKVK